MTNECSIAHCSRPVHARTWCNAHYYRWRTHGDPQGGEAERKPRSVRSCSVSDCEDPSYGRGYCTVHYLRWQRHGSPEVVAYERFNDSEESFARRTRRDGDCLKWVGLANKDGYGVIRAESKSFGAHRYAWERAYGPIPEGLVVRHKCDNPPCVRIEHLELGTPQDNTNDMIARGRSRWQKQESR